jgi:hypothetical protein
MPTEMPRCETCRHWQPSDPPGLEKLDLYASSVCTLARGKDRRFLAVGPNGDEDLATLADFGCIAHEPRE